MFFGTSFFLFTRFLNVTRIRRSSIAEFDGPVSKENNATILHRLFPSRNASVGLVRRIRVVIVIVLGFFLTRKRSANTVHGTRSTRVRRLCVKRSAVIVVARRPVKLSRRRRAPRPFGEERYSYCRRRQTTYETIMPSRGVRVLIRHGTHAT